MQLSIYKIKIVFLLVASVILTGLACQKTGTVPSVSGVAAFTVVNVIPNSEPVIPIINTSQTIMWFSNANTIGYGRFFEYSPTWGNDTVYVVQSNSDTLNVGPKVTGLMFYNLLNLKVGGIYSLFLTGADTTSPDFLFTTDTLPYYNFADSVMGIRFVNLSTGSNPISVNLEGKPNGSEVGSLPYKGITNFGQYINNSTISDYLFVVRDATTGDSLTRFDFIANGSQNNGYGLTDPNNGSNLLTFKNVTVAIYGSESPSSNSPLSTVLIDNY